MAKLLNVALICQLAPLFTLYSKVPEPVAFTTMTPLLGVQVGCVTVGALTVGAVGAVKTTGLLE